MGPLSCALEFITLQKMEQQNELKERIKNWLKEKLLDRQSFASLCGVSVTTINNWLGKKKIPASKIAVIESVMKPTPTEQPKEVRTDIVKETAVPSLSYSSDDKIEVIATQLVPLLKKLKEVDPMLDYNQSVYSLIGKISLN